MSFYNTTSETGETLAGYKGKEVKQTEYVLALFKLMQTPLTPSFVHECYCRDTRKNNTPITSIRRTITDLTKECLLKKLKNKSVGIYGRNEHQWQINYWKLNEGEQQKLF